MAWIGGWGRALSLAATGLGLVCGGCSAGGDVHRDVAVSGAASLSRAFADVATAFEARHPELRVALNLAASSTLREQILAGAPVDVFASADLDNMTQLQEAGLLAGAPRIFARNSLAIATPAHRALVEGLGDFANQSLFLGICAAQVPCGRLALESLGRAGVVPAIDTYEANVRAVLTKVEAGELDAGIVYRTDLQAAAAIRRVGIAEEHNVTTSYPVAVIAGGPNSGGAGRFLEFLVGEPGLAILETHGFLPP